jgi:hypothetical protein
VPHTARKKSQIFSKGGRPILYSLCGNMKKEWKRVEERKRNIKEKEYRTHAQK